MKPKKNYVPGPMDVCLTPPYALNPILSYLKGKTVWECACGKGYLSNIMKENGVDVVSTDITTGHDFLTYQPEFEFDVIVTNPPFGLKYKFIERCYELNKPFALLMPVETHGAEGAQKYFEKHGIETTWLRPRINFEMPNKGWFGGAQFPTAWFTWNLTGEPQRWYDFNKDNDYKMWKQYIKNLETGGENGRGKTH